MGKKRDKNGVRVYPKNGAEYTLLVHTSDGNEVTRHVPWSGAAGWDGAHMLARDISREGTWTPDGVYYPGHQITSIDLLMHKDGRKNGPAHPYVASKG